MGKSCFGIDGNWADLFQGEAVDKIEKERNHGDHTQAGDHAGSLTGRDAHGLSVGVHDKGIESVDQDGPHQNGDSEDPAHLPFHRAL